MDFVIRKRVKFFITFKILATRKCEIIRNYVAYCYFRINVTLPIPDILNMTIHTIVSFILEIQEIKR
uniref:Uncharacterized protein n=1 Tax=Octopus bimaculoides TaxID=37653 RepID=A0A0L8GRS8_OCTBM